jgi:cell division transport system permease protein
MQLASKLQHEPSLRPAQGESVEDPKVWLLYPFVSFWNSFKGGPLPALMSLAIITTVFAINAGLWVVLANLDRIVLSGGREISLSLYLRDGISPTRVEEIKSLIALDQKVDQVSFRSKNEALALFAQELGDQAYVLDGFEKDNPLPASLEVTFVSDETHQAVFDHYKVKFSEFPEVELVEYDSLLLGMLGRVLGYFKLFVACAIPVLLVAAGFVVCLTLSLGMYAHRKELEIKRLVGASSWYVWSPYVFEGGLLGILGAGLGMLLTWGAVVGLTRVLAVDGSPWFGNFEVLFLGPTEVFVLLSLGLCVGALGSFWAGRRPMLGR